MIQTFKLQKEEVGELVQELPPEYLKNSTMVQDIEKSWIDEVLEQGIGIGLEKGLEKGKQVMALDKDIRYILLLSKTLPTITDGTIAKISKLKESFIKRVRKVFQTKRPSTIKRFVRSVYKKVPAMKEAYFLALEESTLLLWKEFQS